MSRESDTKACHSPPLACSALARLRLAIASNPICRGGPMAPRDVCLRDAYLPALHAVCHAHDFVAPRTVTNRRRLGNSCWIVSECGGSGELNRKSITLRPNCRRLLMEFNHASAPAVSKRAAASRKRGEHYRDILPAGLRASDARGASMAACVRRPRKRFEGTCVHQWAQAAAKSALPGLLMATCVKPTSKL